MVASTSAETSSARPAGFVEFAQALAEPILLIAGDGTVVSANDRAASAFALSRVDLEGRRLSDLCVDPPEVVRDFLGRASRTKDPTIASLHRRGGPGGSTALRVQGAVVRPRSGSEPALILMRLRPKESAVQAFVELRSKVEQLVVEVQFRKRIETALRGQTVALESILRGAPLNQILELLVRCIEQSSETEILGSVLLMDSDGVHLHHAAAPSLSEEYMRGIERIPIGPKAGCCGTAAWRREPVITEDIDTDPLWDEYRELARTDDLHSCWSVPIISSGGRVMGTFAMYSRRRRVPDRSERQLVDLFVNTAALAIEAKQSDEERRDLLQRETRARAEAERASQLKDDFLATVSHELRTPLTSVLGWANLLRIHAQDEETRKGLQVIEQSARAQAKLVEDLLDVARISTGRLRLNARRVDLPKLVSDAVDGVRPAADAKRIDLRLSVDEATPPVHGDAERLHQVVWNLASNAIKFTPAGGSVEVRLEGAPGAAKIVVHDNGAGIPPEFLPRLFQRFSQMDGSASRTHSGLGLGLSIVRSLVELHGGTVTAESEGHGRGATFVVTLPASGEASADRPAADTTGSRVDPEWDLRGVRVLLVEDDPASQFLLHSILERSGAMVTAAASAEEALQSFRHSQPDVIVSDIAMPGRDGLALIREIREASGVLIPAVAVTALTRDADRDASMRAGFQAHLAKPFEPEDLLSTVASLCGRARV